MFNLPASYLSPNLLNQEDNWFHKEPLLLVLGNSDMSGIILQPWFKSPEKYNFEITPLDGKS